MKRTILGMTEAGEPLLQQASEAIRRHREAESKGRPLRGSRATAIAGEIVIPSSY